MNKQTTRAFATGLLVSAIILICYNLMFEKKQAETHTTKPNYVEIKESEYEDLKQQAENWQAQYEVLAASSETAKSTSNQNEPEPKKYQLKIVDGMSSKEISIQLADAGIIQDAEKFNRYLAKRKLQHYIQIGKFDINDGMDYKQIANVITKKP
ncbi:endolytic transglycosylase MltG [Lederbergia citrea]|uniref:endolytic transglycosylase MltG n=1 Tax=Lederbergia citrea TaxID=2833581 RepID=UPI001BC8F215|nr:endolytic transglycosylase MltG [Lederbergia citrea]MBS4176337.1 endolytic transglycosylase MltG [Lederbergia citrea]MBS4202898.1 endolytic transglycosylase MltG [Lederbergia citrea]